MALDEDSGVSEMDHASPFRNRMLDAAVTELVDVLGVKADWALADAADICLPDSKIEGRFNSSH